LHGSGGDAVEDIVPRTWVNQVPGDTGDLTDENLNTEIRDSYALLYNPPTCVVVESNVQTIPNGTGWTAITWDAAGAIVDTEDPATPMFSGTLLTRVTCQTPGYYELTASMGVGTGVSTVVVLTAAFRVNGTSVYAGDTSQAPASAAVYVSPCTLIPLNAGDYVELVVTHNYSAPIGTHNSSFMPGMTLVRRRGL
jgi:hypothetical protein